MNRPNEKDYRAFDETTSCDEFLPYSYIAHLEAYCDELEAKIKFVDEKVIPDYERVQKELWELQEKYNKLDKAFDNALHFTNCELLDVEDMWCEYNKHGECAGCLKKHFMKEVMENE